MTPQEGSFLEETRGTITTKHGTPFYDKRCDTRQPVVSSHGWPLTADAWDQMLFLASPGYRCIAHDRRREPALPASTSLPSAPGDRAEEE